MEDAEIVELGTDGAPAVAAMAAQPGRARLSNELDEPGDEPAPESAPRPAAAALDGESDLEPPIKTPPPESGRQVVASAAVGITGEMALEAGPDAGEALEADMTGGPISKAPAGMPTMEQLGDTVELEGADGPPARIELLSAPMSTAQDAALDDLELSLPKLGFTGGYDAALGPPSRAAADLERLRAELLRKAEPPSEAPLSLSSLASDAASGLLSSIASTAASATAPKAAPVVPDTASAATPKAAPEPPAEPLADASEPVVIQRQTLGAMPVVVVRAAVAPRIPETFLELLDASLELSAS